MRNAGPRVWWPWALTAAVLLSAVVVYALSPDMNTRSQLGDYLSGFAGAIAFIWLVAAYLQQGHELRLQRQELSLQRQSLNLQRDEVRKLGKYAALEQVARLLEQFDLSLRNDPKSLANSANDLPTVFMGGISLWKTLLESKDPYAVFDAYTRWMTIYGPCDEFVSRVASAVDLYGEASGHPPVYATAPPAERIYFGFDQLKDIPHVRHYIGAAHAVASNLILMAPGLDRVQLAGLEATEALMPGVVKAEAIEELRAKVKAREDARKAAKTAEEKIGRAHV